MAWTPRVTVAAVIAEQSRFLLVRERIDGQIVLNQPAGHLEDDESLIQAVRREVLEETAREFEPRGLVGIYRWRMPKGKGQHRTYLRFCFAGSVGEPITGRELDPDILDTRWLDAHAIKNQPAQLRSPLVWQCIGDYLSTPLTPLTALHDAL